MAKRIMTKLTLTLLRRYKMKKQRIKEKKNLSITNFGDIIVIKNRSAIASAVLGSIILAFLGAVMLILKDAWDNAIFWVVFAFIVLSTAYMLANAFFGKIVLNSPEMTMTVYFPFKVEYKFSDINYIDVRSSKPKEGIVTHKVSAYIGNGKSSVDVVTTSKAQADEIASLLRGMLDNGAMEYPECEEAPIENNDLEGQKSVSPLSDEKERSGDDTLDFKPIEKKADLDSTDKENSECEMAPEESDKPETDGTDEESEKI